jgi:hypothetical protein
MEDNLRPGYTGQDICIISKISPDHLHSALLVGSNQPTFFSGRQNEGCDLKAIASLEQFFQRSPAHIASSASEKDLFFTGSHNLLIAEQRSLVYPYQS